MMSTTRTYIPSMLNRGKVLESPIIPIALKLAKIQINSGNTWNFAGSCILIFCEVIIII